MGLTARDGLVLLAAVVTALATARLGLWQLDRAAQKTQAQAALQARRAMPVLTVNELARNAKDATTQQHRSVLLQGQWQSQFTVYLDNRQMNNRPGFFAVTPLLLADGSAVLVQRGWLPRHISDRTRINAPITPSGPVQVQGRVEPTLSRSFELSAAEESGAIRQNVQLDTFAVETKLPLRPLVVVQEDPVNAAIATATATATASAAAMATAASPATNPDGLLRQWPAPATGIDKHHGYAFQWFALSALTVGLYAWFQIVRPKRKARRQPNNAVPAANPPSAQG
jgi:surfeit locus 1 family protein